MTVFTPTITALPPLEPGRYYRQFLETGRWAVSLPDGEVIGEVWRGLRMDSVVCWMVQPSWIRASLPHSRVKCGYARTSRKGSAEELARWASLRSLRLEVAGEVLWCTDLRDFGDYETRSYLAVADSQPIIDLHFTLNRVPRWSPGATEGGGVGWHGYSSRGPRMICANDFPSLETAAETLLTAARRPSTEQDRRDDQLRRHTAERHHGSQGAANASAGRFAAFMGGVVQRTQS
ncbi:MAG: hypothetical protein F8N36_12090 [Desulfovibrio sp.]|uniref:hypothetical protein n=1 Tax=Desulfovibrio sp. TaxID=885 RepID=UPI00135EA6C7|nr:hypothetical protein [Desulfovibrio sp.]MTJ93588.1 hypothetical protein [Desulfovibrio sp.]